MEGTELKVAGPRLIPLIFYMKSSSVAFKYVPASVRKDTATGIKKRKYGCVMISLSPRSDGRFDRDNTLYFALGALDSSKLVDTLDRGFGESEDRFKLIHKSGDVTKTFYLGPGKDSGSYGISVVMAGKSLVTYVDGDSLMLLSRWMSKALDIMLMDEPPDLYDEEGAFDQVPDQDEEQGE